MDVNDKRLPFWQRPQSGQWPMVPHRGILGLRFYVLLPPPDYRFRPPGWSFNNPCWPHDWLLHRFIKSRIFSKLAGTGLKRWGSITRTSLQKDKPVAYLPRFSFFYNRNEAKQIFDMLFWAVGLSEWSSGRPNQPSHFPDKLKAYQTTIEACLPVRILY